MKTQEQALQRLAQYYGQMPRDDYNFLDQFIRTLGNSGGTYILTRDIKKGFFTETETVSCGPNKLEGYLRGGYQINWQETDTAQIQPLPPAPKKENDDA